MSGHRETNTCVEAHRSTCGRFFPTEIERRYMQIYMYACMGRDPRMRTCVYLLPSLEDATRAGGWRKRTAYRETREAKVTGEWCMYTGGKGDSLLFRRRTDESTDEL